jgi:acetyl-CoA carboxylase carboxyl transferase subunit beta
MAGSMGLGRRARRSRARSSLALAERRAVVIVTARAGARMQEGILSLMQMAKTSALLATLKEERLPFVSILPIPSTAGRDGVVRLARRRHPGRARRADRLAGPRVIQTPIGRSCRPASSARTSCSSTG